MKKICNFFYNSLDVQGVIAYCYEVSKQIGIFLDVLRVGKDCYRLKKDWD